MNQPTIILPGGSGFLGRTLAKWFSSKGWHVVILSRNPQAIVGAQVVVWDGQTLGPWTEQLEGAKVVVNLAGRSVNCRYNVKNREEIMASRKDSTLILGQAIAACENPPSVWLNSSTATIYRHRFDAANTESDGLYGASPEAKDAFSLQVAHAWESAFEQAYQQNDLTRTRAIILRTAMVFGNEPGGVYETLARLARRGLGGTMGHGRQFVSWLHEADFCESIAWLIDNETANGIYNLASPHPLPNRTMMSQLRRAVGMCCGLPATRLMLELGALFLRTETELILKSRRVEPERLLKEGYRFRFPDFATALNDLEGKTST
jgi:uncharacterized protein (TIGR01777 family)